MKYINVFADEAAYNASSGSLEKPQLSYITDGDKIFSLSVSSPGPGPSEQPNDEIWYTTTDDQIFDISTWMDGWLDEDSILGNHVASNIYKDGKGIVKFSNDVSAIGQPYDESIEKSILYPVFAGSNTIKTITLPSSVTLIEEIGLCESSLQSIIIPEGTQILEGCIFNYCTNLQNINIPSTVTSISESIIGGAINITEITVNEQNNIYDSRNNCNAIIETATNTLISGCKTTVIPDSVIIIGDSAFSDLDTLTNITIPSSITSIQPSAFGRCHNLTNITSMNTTPPTVIGWAFEEVPTTAVVKVPASAVAAYQAADGWKEFTIEALPE